MRNPDRNIEPTTGTRKTAGKIFDQADDASGASFFCGVDLSERQASARDVWAKLELYL